MVVTLQLVLAASPAKRLSDVYGGTPGVPDEIKNVSYRQLVISTTGAVAAVGSALAVTPATGFSIAVAGPPLVLGPFPSGAVKLSDLYGVGAGATLTILGVPF
jgi:hypothetical protein